MTMVSYVWLVPKTCLDALDSTTDASSPFSMPTLSPMSTSTKRYITLTISKVDEIEPSDHWQGSGNVFVVHHKVNETWQALGSCYGLPIALVVGSTVGILFVIGIGLLVATIVIINLNDLRR